MKAIVDVLGSPESPSCRRGEEEDDRRRTMMPSAVVEDERRSRTGATHREDHQQEEDDASSTLINSEAISTDDCDNFKDSPFTKLNGKLSNCLEYILDITIGYPNGKPLDLPNIVHGFRNPCQTYLFYRLYRSSEVPRDSESLTRWLYDRFFEKERLLEEFYRTGTFPAGGLSSSPSPRTLPTVVQQDLLRFLLIHLFFVTSTYVHYQLILMLINYSNVMYVYLLSNS